MKVNVKFGPRFRELFEADAKDVDVEEGADVRSLLALICDSEKRRFELFGNGTNLRPSVVVTKNGRFIIHLNWLDTKLEEGDRVEILTLHCGG